MNYTQTFKNLNDGFNLRFEPRMHGDQIIFNDLSVDTGFLLEKDLEITFEIRYTKKLSDGTVISDSVIPLFLETSYSALTTYKEAIVACLNPADSNDIVTDNIYPGSPDLDAIRAEIIPSSRDIRNNVFKIIPILPYSISDSGVIVPGEWGDGHNIEYDRIQYLGPFVFDEEDDLSNILNLNYCSFITENILVMDLIKNGGGLVDNMQIQTHPYRYLDINLGTTDHRLNTMETRIHRINNPTLGYLNLNDLAKPLALTKSQITSDLEVIIRNDLNERIKLIRPMHLGFISLNGGSAKQSNKQNSENSH